MATYVEFTRSNGGLAIDGGPWKVIRSEPNDVNCGSLEPMWCESGKYCLSAWVLPCATRSSYSVSFYTDIAVNISQFYGLTTLEYEWQYSVWWGSTKVAPGVNLPITSSVDGEIYNNTLTAGNYTQLFTYGTGWNDPPFKNNGLTVISTNPERTIGYIHLAINITFPRQAGETINYYVKNAEFKIVIPEPPSPITMITHETPTSRTSGYISSTATVSYGASGPLADQPSSVSIGTLIGSMMGATIFVILIMLGLFCCWRQRLMRRGIGRVATEEKNSPSTTIESQRMGPLDDTPTRDQGRSMIPEQAPPPSAHRLSTTLTANTARIIDNPPGYSLLSLPHDRPDM
ncbi:hypothetical protein FRC20_001797 [Serendipita sp. 405]|nr:hypothetical protein FRC15_002127 [Serendipita sp. 397]KAG8787158.1 hypothetical protein FRC16_001587 [Serendipita sp. 398]KAG8851181.1 hypothetical protein FRC20_001797 [Serendipita sp. 405]